MFSSNHISNFNKPRSSINNYPLDNKSSDSSQPVQKVHLKSVPQPNSNNSLENAQHKLQCRYNLWYSKRAPGKLISTQSYDQTLKLLANFGTIEQFWQIYAYLIRPSELETLTEIHVFKDGCKPMWEEDRNKDGGKFILKFKKGVISRLWENILIAVLGEQFLVGDEINGVVLSIRHHFDAISLWNQNSTNSKVINHIRETLRRVLNLNQNFIIEYKVFNQRPNQANQANQAN